MSLALVVEVAVVVLLLITIGYCALLERRIQSFRIGQASLGKLVAELNQATKQAETAVGGLVQTTKDAELALEERLVEARQLTRALALGNRGQSAGAQVAKAQAAKAQATKAQAAKSQTTKSQATKSQATNPQASNPRKPI